jgi:hypothetical protein
MIHDPNSLFPIVVFDKDHNWETLLSLATPHLSPAGLGRLKPILDGACKSVIVEHHYIDKDYRDTFSNFHSKRFNTPRSRCVRLHFFRRAVTADEVLVAPHDDPTYLGYSVVRPTQPNCIGRTFLSHALRLHRDSHLSVCKETVHIMGARFEIEGFPFISQDADATVCAESALWMLLRYYSNRYSWYSEILPFQITNLATNHAGSRVYPSGGLYSWQLAEGLRIQRFSPVVYSKQQFGANFHHLLYTYIESGLPLILAVPQHVVVSYGHRSDYTVAVPAPSAAAPFAYTSLFNRSYVISDDNRFPYQMLNAGGPIDGRDSAYKWDDIEEFIVPLPEKVFLTAEHVQTAIEALLKRADFGIAKKSPLLASKHVVLRLFLTSARSFKRRLKERGMGCPAVETIYRQLPMPHFIWVCEIADSAEYSTDRKVWGEIIWDATRNAYEPDGWIALHYPEWLAVDAGSAFNEDQFFKTFDLPTQNSYSLFRSNLHTL